jgi:hypothetical protein
MTRFLVVIKENRGLRPLGGGGALSDERVGLSFVGSLCHDFYVVSEYLHRYIHSKICTICARPLSVQTL